MLGIQKKRQSVLPILMVVLLLLLITQSVASAHGNANPRVLPPNSRVQGLTYGEWSVKWWQYVLSVPASENPLIGATGPGCGIQRIGNVALVVADPTMGEAIACEVPAGTMLFLDILSAECSTVEEDPFYGEDEEEMRACAEAFKLSKLQASIDGIAIHHLTEYIHTSPLFDFTVPEDNILGVEAGSGQSVSNGAHLLLAPLAPGEHTIHLHGEYSKLEFAADLVFDFTVTPGR